MDKINFFLDKIIDDIEIKDNNILIKTKNNILLSHDGDFIQFINGVYVVKSEEIHLNPDIEIKALKKEIDNINVKKIKKEIENSKV